MGCYNNYRDRHFIRIEEQRDTSLDSSEKYGRKEEAEKQQIKGDFQNQTVHSLGIKLEETVEQILKDKGYYTETRKKMIGNSKAFHEIDILAKRQNKVLAVECKNYNDARIVGIKEIRDFQSKLQDLPDISNGMFVSNTSFSSEAETYAKHNQISLYDGERLKNDFYLMSIGRLESVQDIVLDFSLPISRNYNEVSRLDLVNPTAGRISRATLILSPFYVFDYMVDVTTIKPHSKFKIHNLGEYAVIKHESKVPIDAARRIVKEEIVEEKKVNYDNVQIADRAPSCIYVPKWVINIESHNAAYTREILAGSNTTLMDEIAYCPHEFFARFRPTRKETYALCERCGGAYCSRHIQRLNDSYFCKEHR